tara:strand:+ start:233 stop:1465 length:1233 start_codon:yes stop_codon:yes gene_type:complete
MDDLSIHYKNLDENALKNFINLNSNLNLEIKNVIKNLRLFNIINDEKIVSETINKVNEFALNKKNFIVFGTGGSNLGARALINILHNKEKNYIEFYDNIDPVSFKNSLNKFNLEEIGFIIISKSGSTLETISQFTCLIEIFEQKNKLKIFYQNCLIITENKASPIRNIALQNKCKILDHDPNIGGRYSVFSNVGMVPALLAGIDVKKIHEGVNVFLNNINTDLFKKYLKFGTLISSKKFFNKNINVLMTYSDSLHYFGKWYLQLWSESIGKNGLGLTPIHATGTTDQHSQLQLFLDGPKDKFFTFVTTNHKGKGLMINRSILDNNNLQFLAGKFMGDLMEAEQKATIDTFINNKFAIREIKLPEINEYYIGKLMALCIFETITACYCLNVNPFDQPAVEEGKILTKKYLK